MTSEEKPLHRSKKFQFTAFYILGMPPVAVIALLVLCAHGVSGGAASAAVIVGIIVTAWLVKNHQDRHTETDIAHLNRGASR